MTGQSSGGSSFAALEHVKCVLSENIYETWNFVVHRIMIERAEHLGN